MRELKDGTKIIAVDHGYGNIKTANTVTPTGLIAYETEPIFTGSILKYEGTYYRIGEGHKEFVSDKASDDEYYLLTLMAVARELNIQGIQEADVYLAAGLPLTWIRVQREEFRRYLMRNEDVRFTFNSKDYHMVPVIPIAAPYKGESPKSHIAVPPKAKNNTSLKRLMPNDWRFYIWMRKRSSYRRYTGSRRPKHGKSCTNARPGRGG